jgi:GNAT superfamily N-acetyltransferase
VKQIDVDSAVVEGESVFDIFDYSATTIGYFEDLYDYHRADFKDSVLRTLGCANEYVPSTLLIVDRLELKPEYRGRGIGLQAMKILISRFRVGAGIAAIKPFPLQFEAGADDDPDAFRKRGFDKYANDEGRCQKRLQAHYARLGFKKIPRTPYMCLPLVERLGW